MINTMETKRYVGVLIKYGKQILLVKRNADEPKKSIWTIPGGKMIEGLKIRTAATQMLLENTSIVVDEEKLQMVGLIPRETKDGKEEKGLMYVYLYEVNSALLPIFESSKKPKKHIEHGYFTVEHIQLMNCGKHLPNFVETIFS
jgi:ADP-ribose pyrophosphatase YjhB (NUDIX family)